MSSCASGDHALFCHPHRSRDQVKDFRVGRDWAVGTEHLNPNHSFIYIVSLNWSGSTKTIPRVLCGHSQLVRTGRVLSERKRAHARAMYSTRPLRDESFFSAAPHRKLAPALRFKVDSRLLPAVLRDREQTSRFAALLLTSEVRREIVSITSACPGSQFAFSASLTTNQS